ncbi:GP179 protein, partial [Ptilonorhynchus violaceus]|nr:GP179 protein [Ptilonorhynchus violaceus]
KSQSTESQKAEICPWEAQELKSSDKSEICPWEAAEPPSGKEKPRQDKVGLSMVSKSPSTGQGLQKEMGDGTSGKKDRESICPWESPDTEQPPAKPQTGSSALPKAPSGKSRSTESQKAEICPWELESPGKAEICPWEVAEPPSGKEKPKQDKEGASMVSKS